MDSDGRAGRPARARLGCARLPRRVRRRSGLRPRRECSRSAPRSRLRRTPGRHVLRRRRLATRGGRTQALRRHGALRRGRPAARARARNVDPPPMTVAYGVIRPPGQEPRVCARVDGRILDLSGLGAHFAQPSLNAFLALGRDVWRETTAQLRGFDGPAVAGEAVLPFEVADYVDFYSSLEHATNLGRILRPDSEPLLPNWRHLPVGYHGRAGTVVVSGTPVRRPHGQRAPGPTFGPSERLDVELELGFVVGTPSRQ